MFARVFQVLTSAGLLFQSLAATGNTLEPIGRWVVDYRTDQCLASREYGTAEKPIVFGIRPAPNGESYALLVAQKRSGPRMGKEEKGTVDFGSGPIKSWLLEYGQSASDVYQFRISAAEVEQAKTALNVKLTSEHSSLEFRLESMPQLIKALEDCTANLMSYWNMGGEKDGRIAKLSRGDIRHLFSSDDYPAEASSHSQSGTSQYILLIDETGKVAGCDVVLASGIPALDVMGCQVIRSRAKITPALDANGKPVRSTLVTPPIAWKLR